MLGAERPTKSRPHAQFLAFRVSERVFSAAVWLSTRPSDTADDHRWATLAWRMATICWADGDHLCAGTQEAIVGVLGAFLGGVLSALGLTLRL